jgi:hypothetical protein
LYKNKKNLRHKGHKEHKVLRHFFVMFDFSVPFVANNLSVVFSSIQFVKFVKFVDS